MNIESFLANRYPNARLGMSAERYLELKQIELDNTIGFLTMMHGDYFNVIRRAAQMRYKSKGGSFEQYLWDYHAIEQQKYPAGRHREFIYCPTCRNSFAPVFKQFKQCPVCASDQLSNQ
jgi:hypothetical protein